MKSLTLFLALAILVVVASVNGSQKKYIYYTTDDGINAGTSAIMDAAKEAGVKVTFFINGDTMNSQNWGDGIVADNIRYLLRMIREEHAVGDHSINHMAHNSDTEPATGRNIYRKTSDVDYFGKANIAVFAKILQSVGVNALQTRALVRPMTKMVRMPFVNNWRVKMANGQPDINFTCRNCIVPYDSAKIAGEVADLLFKSGKQVFGWDMEWRSSYGDGLTQSPEEVMKEVRKFSAKFKQAKGGPNKIVILNHDHGFMYGDEPKEALVKFFQMAQKEGYEFRTLETYATD